MRRLQCGVSGIILVSLWLALCLTVMRIAAMAMSPLWLIAHGVSLVALGGLGSLLVLGGRRWWREQAALRHLRQVARPCPPSLAADLRGITEASYVRIIADAHPYALCAGFGVPLIFISQGLITLLPLAALKAAVAHEEAHRQRRDPLRRFLATLGVDLLCPTRGMQEVVHRLRLHAEMVADRQARQATSTRDVAMALLAVVQTSAPSSATTSFTHLHDGPGELQVRIHQLGQPVAAALPRPLSGWRRFAFHHPLPLLQSAVLGSWVFVLALLLAAPTLLPCVFRH